MKNQSVSHSDLSQLCGFTDYSPPGSSVHGISQAKILEWVATSFQAWGPRTAGRFFIPKPPQKPIIYIILQLIYAADISKQNDWFSFFFVPEEDKIYSKAQYNKNVRVSKRELLWLESNKRK